MKTFTRILTLFGIALLLLTATLIYTRRQEQEQWMLVQTVDMIYLVNPNDQEVFPLEMVGSDSLYFESTPDKTAAFFSFDPTYNYPYTYSIYKYDVISRSLKPLTTGSVSARVAGFSSDNEWLYYYYYGRHTQINRMRLDGSHQENLTGNQSVSYLMALSHDDSGLIYLIFNNDQFEWYYLSFSNLDIKHVLTTDQLSFRTLIQHEEWLYFLKTNGLGTAIYRMRDDGTQLENIAAAGFYNLEIGWSDDGEWIVFTDDGEVGWQIFRMRPDGSDLQQLTFDQADNHFFDISPDGEWIFYRSTVRYSRLKMMRLDGTDQQFLSQEFEEGGAISWSPDGNWLIFLADANLYTIEMDTYDKAYLSTGYISDIKWSSDSQWIAFVLNDILLYRARPDGSEIQLLNDFQQQVFFLGWTPTIDLTFNPISLFIASLALIGGSLCVGYCFFRS